MRQKTDLGRQILELVARKAVTIPPAPEVALRLQELVASRQFDVGHLARLVGTEQALMAAVLRAANSAAVRGLAPITVLSDAVGRLGTAELCRIAIATTLGQVAGRDGALSELRRLVWRRGLTSAIFCKILGERRGMKAEELFTCGLLHDFGWIAGIVCLERLLAKLPDEPERTADEWLDLIDGFHLQLGAMVATAWKLSPVLSAVMTSHHDPHGADGHRATIDIVATSDRLVALLEAKPFISPADVALVPGVRAEEAELLAHVISDVPVLVANLLDAAPETAAGIYSKVSKPMTLLGAVKPTQLPGTWLRQGGTIPVSVVAMAADGLVVQLGERPKENYLMKLRVDTPAGPLEVCGNAVLSTSEANEHRAEVRLFAVGGKAQDAWNELYSRN
jgi:HD-like signal output (HDOD) protein